MKERDETELDEDEALDDELDEEEFDDDELDDEDPDDEDAGVAASAGRATGFALGLLLGVAIGAGAALLLAPASGHETRRRIRRGIDDARERIDDDVHRLRRRVGRRLRRR